MVDVRASAYKAAGKANGSQIDSALKAIIDAALDGISYPKGDLIPFDQPDSQAQDPNQTPNQDPVIPDDVGKMAWGAKVSSTFRDRIRWICDDPKAGLGMDPNDLMACIAWETGRTFSPSVKNAAGSGATGLIQFMPKTAINLGTTTAKLATMTAEDQLNYVYKYFLPWKGKLKNLSDLYMAILWPKAVGQPEHYVLWSKGTMPKTFAQNAGLDLNKDDEITKAECSAKLYAMKAEGLRKENLG